MDDGMDETVERTAPEKVIFMTNTQPSGEQSEYSDDEELECRVCRGPEEKDRPLYSPCKCSGSIGLTHQDCLTSWLAVTRGDGRCELCGVKFRFKPKYAAGAPDRLPPHEVFLGLCTRAAVAWFPLAVRVGIVASVWLAVAPLSTTYLYHGWMHRPSSILKRLRWDLIPGDIVSGITILAIIIVSFLSFMSFADFLRFNWQQDGLQGRPRDFRDRLVRQENGQDETEQAGDVIDDVMLELEKEKRAIPEQERVQHGAFFPYDPREVQFLEPRPRRERPRRVRWRDDIINNLRVDEIEDRIQQRMNLGPRANFGEEMDGAEGEDQHVQQNDDRHPERAHDEVNRNEHEFPPERNRFEPQFEPLDPAGNLDDEADMELNVPLDELLGLRGPINNLIRNLLWLLAFNTTYLGIFAFVPKNCGSTMNAIVFNTTAVSGWTKNIPYFYSENSDGLSLTSIVVALNAESSKIGSTIQLPDLAMILLGYFAMGLGVLSLQAGVFMYKKFRRHARADRSGRMDQNRLGPRRDDADRAGGRNPRFADDNVNGDPRDGIDLAALRGRPDQEGAPTLGEYLSVALDCLKALVKVGFLLFFKMLLLPLVLGIWLDVATLDMFRKSASSRILFSGGDLFSSILLHWVAGITFMLLVTVSVLQLREVVHPDLLGPIIRPQEPQPDLLGNLLHENVSTHARRMLLSFVIYSVLLTIHVWLPARILMASPLARFIPFSQLRFWYVLMPQLQIPLELLVFHLAMLALLERYKNQIGTLQHRWLVFLAKCLGLTENIIPRRVDKFVLIGSRPVFLSSSEDVGKKSTTDRSDSLGKTSSYQSSASSRKQVDPFWYDLASKHKSVDVESFLMRGINVIPEMERCTTRPASTQRNGERSLTEAKFIRLPSREGWTSRRRKRQHMESSESTDEPSTLLSTSHGRYRLRPIMSADDAMVIEIWKEVAGDPIPRPPAGWDDLGIGGAEVQGRWAWGKEKKSKIERGVAVRTPFLGRDGYSFVTLVMLVVKGMTLTVLSWLATTLVVFSGLCTPLAVGRALLYLLRFSEGCIHDPFAFALGVCVLIPCLRLLIGVIKSRCLLWRLLLLWMSRFSLPPIRKLIVFSTSAFLWFAVVPTTLGFLYELLFVKSSDFFEGMVLPEVASSIWMLWATGTLLLNCWAYLCYSSVLTAAFWRNVGGAVDRDGEAVAAVNARQGEAQQLDARVAVNAVAQTTCWQGPNGRVGRFFSILNAALLGGEWDQVDGNILLRECAFPVARQILLSILGSSHAFAIWFLLSRALGVEDIAFDLPVIGSINTGFCIMVLFRYFGALTISLQLLAANQGALTSWFDAAHKAARDGRYLEGEVLMNYSPKQASGAK